MKLAEVLRQPPADVTRYVSTGADGEPPWTITGKLIAVITNGEETPGNLIEVRQDSLLVTVDVLEFLTAIGRFPVPTVAARWVRSFKDRSFSPAGSILECIRLEELVWKG